MITVNLDKAKIIAHQKRRISRSEEFKPLDEQISKQIPGVDTAAIEAERQNIRNKHATIQNQINSATSVDDLLEIVNALAFK